MTFSSINTHINENVLLHNNLQTLKFSASSSKCLAFNVNKRRKRKRSDYIRQHLTTDTLSSSFKRINIHHQRTSDNVVSPLLRFSRSLILSSSTPRSGRSTATQYYSKSYGVGGVRHIGGRSSISPIGIYRTLAWVPTAPNNPGTCPTNQPPHPRVSRAHKQHHSWWTSRARILVLCLSW